MTQALPKALVGEEVAIKLPVEVQHKHQSWEYTLVGSQQNRAVAHARGQPEIDKVCELLSTPFKSGPTYWFQIAKLLQCRFSWPGFVAYMRTIQADGVVLRAGKPRLRDQDIPLDKTFGFGYADTADRLATYAKSIARPPSNKAYDRNLDRIRLFESAHLDLGPYFQLAQSLSTRALATYLEWACTPVRIQEGLPNGDIDADVCRELRAAGLLLLLSEAPIELIVQRLGPRELPSPIWARGIKPASRSTAWTVQFYKDNMDTDYERALRIIAEVDGKHALMPPQGQTWEELQDFRAAYAQMAGLLSVWMLGGDIPEPLRALAEVGDMAAAVSEGFH